jgi:hypothetical protein
MQDFHKRIDLAIFWMFEEYMSDLVTKESSQLLSPGLNQNDQRNYQFWLSKLLHAMKGDSDNSENQNTDISTGLDVRDRIFTRFLVEVPMLSAYALDFVKDYCLEAKR